MSNGNYIVDIPDDTPDPLFGVWEWEYNDETDDEGIVHQVAEAMREDARKRWTE